MRFFVPYIAVIFFLGQAMHVHAQENDTPKENSVASDQVPLDIAGGDSNADDLDSLFAELKKQTKAPAAKLISKRIWSNWMDSGSKSIDLLMSRAATSMNDKKNALALDVLAQVIRLKPEYAEGWNRRATLYFSMNDFGRSIADIEKTLALEPRHFGALSGLAIILKSIGKKQASLDTWYKVLEIYPAHQQAQKEAIKLIEDLAGERT